MSRALVGAAVGASGATAYYSLPDLQHVIRTVVAAPARPGPGSEVEGLQKMVEQLAREIRRGSSVTIVNPNGSTTRISASTLSVLLLLLAGVGYMRFFKGWQLTDLLYVTRGSLRNMEEKVQGGLAELQNRVALMRRYIADQVDKLTAKQDAAMAAQEQLKEQLGDVGREVEGTRDQVLQVHDAVRSLEGNLDELNGGLQYANQGIYVLCKVLGEMMQGGGVNKHRGALKELQEYIKNPPVLAERAPVSGLEGILRETEGGSSMRRLSSGMMMLGGVGGLSISPESLGDG